MFMTCNLNIKTKAGLAGDYVKNGFFSPDICNNNSSNCMRYSTNEHYRIANCSDHQSHLILMEYIS